MNHFYLLLLCIIENVVEAVPKSNDSKSNQPFILRIMDREGSD